MTPYNDILKSANPTMTILKATLVEDMKDTDYRNNDGLNQSYLKTVYVRGVPHAQADKLLPREETKALTIGSAFHCLTLEPDMFASKFAVCPKVDRRTNVGKEAFANFEAESEGKTIVMHDDYILAKRMCKSTIPYSIQDCYDPHGSIGENTKTEIAFLAQAKVLYFWEGREEYFPVQLKGRLDILTTKDGNVIIRDLKSLDSLSDYKVNKSARDSLWSMQSAFYSDIVSFAVGKPVSFEYYCTEKDEPIMTRQFNVCDEMIARGRGQYLTALVKHLDWEQRGKPMTYDYVGPTALNA
jgi:hypothetical protein